jgi:chloramphenicol-sensitive protein RarD
MNQQKNYKTGLLLGFGAYLIWGLFPLYWPLLKPANPVEIVSHRAVWSLITCLILLAIIKKLKPTFEILKNPQTMFRLLASTVLISINWLTYIWGVNHNHVVECALGYYINPLIVIGFGVILFKEKMRKLQWFAVLTAAVGVIVLTVDFGRPPWVSIILALSWGSYGVVKKQLGIGALEGLTIETLIAFLPYAGYLIFLEGNHQGQFGHHLGLSTLLFLAGAVTAIPLLMFNGSTNILPFTIIGLLQYITPTVQFMVGVIVRHEPMPTGRWIGFFIIWFALIALGTDLVRSGSSMNNRIAEMD